MFKTSPGLPIEPRIKANRTPRFTRPCRIWFSIPSPASPVPSSYKHSKFLPTSRLFPWTIPLPGSFFTWLTSLSNVTSPERRFLITLVKEAGYSVLLHLG